MKKLLMIMVVMLCKICCAYAATDTAHIYFKLNEETLYKPAITTLDSLLYHDVINNGTSVLIIGYADYLGSEEHNLGLSKRRATTIQEYLTRMHIPKANIKLVIGKGKVSRNLTGKDGYATDRRVDIVTTNIIKNAARPRKSAIRTGELPPVKSNSILANMKVGQTIRLQNIYFVMGRHVMTDASFPALDKLYEILDDNPNLKIQIEGHVCCLKYGYDATDDDTHENVLSLNRAKYIYEYLVKKGIEKDRLKYIGFGRSKPLVSPEKSPEDEDQNRRVEIRVIGK